MNNHSRESRERERERPANRSPAFPARAMNMKSGLICLVSSVACQGYLCHQVEAFSATLTWPTLSMGSRNRKQASYAPLQMSSSSSSPQVPNSDEQEDFFEGYDEFIEELDAALTDDYAGSTDAAGREEKGYASGGKSTQKRELAAVRNNRSSRNRSSSRSRKNYEDDGSVATYQDEKYEMFLSNLEKDMIEGWRKELEAARARDAPLSMPRFDPDDDYDEDENYSIGSAEVNEDSATQPMVAGIEINTSTADFLATLSLEQVKERLREAGMPVGGTDKSVLIQRLLGEETSPTAAFLSSLTVPQLKERLREAGLPVSGRKAELVDRLLGI